MMKLSTVQSVGATVGSDGRCLIAEEILGKWGFDHGSVKIVRLSSNCVFEFRQRGVRRFLRFVPAWEQQRRYIEAETQLLAGLAKSGLCVAQPVPSRVGNIVETVDTNVGTFHAVVFTALTGRHLELDDLDEFQYREWGATLGRLHTVMQGITPQIRRPTHTDHLAFIGEHIRYDEPLLRREWDVLNAWVDTLGRNQDHYGLIHFDFELDNICWDNGMIQMLDFDDCVYHWYMADIACALGDLFRRGVTFDDALVQSFLAGYREHHSLDEEYQLHLPMFLRMRALFGYAQLVRSVDISIEETSEWLRHLHSKFTQKITAYKVKLHAPQ